MKSPNQTTLNLIFLGVVVYMTLFFQLGRMAFVGADEPRYARVAEEMKSGGDYIVPVLRGKAWLEKPPLYYWLAAASYRAFGVNEASARLPGALCSAAAVLLLFGLARKLWSEEVGFFAALMLASSPLFFIFSRAASTDSLLAAFLNAGLLIYLAAFQQQSLWLFLASGASFGLATLAKGPIALLLAAMSVLPTLVVFPSRKRILGSLTALAALLIVAVPWFWQIVRRTGFAFLSVFVLNHNLARYFTTLHHHEHPFYYYLPVLGLGLFPWSLLAFFFAVQFLRTGSLRSFSVERTAGQKSATLIGTDSSRNIYSDGNIYSRRDPKLFFLACWVLLPVLFFSASRSKLPAYILPAAMPAVILIALLLARLTEFEYRKTRRAAFGGLTAVSIPLGVLGFIAGARLYGHPATVGGLGLLLAGGCVLAWRMSRRGLSAALVALAGTNVAMVVYLTLFLLPVVQDFHSTRSVLRQALRQLPASEQLYQYRYFHQTVDYYSGGRAVMDPIRDLDELRKELANHSPLWLVTDVKELPQLQAQSDFKVQTLASRGNVVVLKVTGTG
ncbi:MAG TPA: glycosyltransferase family 39 protein [Acidobacteriota bacterium]